MTQVSAMRSVLKVVLKLSGKGHTYLLSGEGYPYLLSLLSLELLAVSSFTIRDSLPENDVTTKELRVRGGDRVLVTLFKHLNPAVSEAIPEIESWSFLSQGQSFFC